MKANYFNLTTSLQFSKINLTALLGELAESKSCIKNGHSDFSVVMSSP